MNTPHSFTCSLRSLGLAAAAGVLVGYSVASFGADISVKLSGDQEVPPVMTKATGSGRITINPDMTVSGKVSTTGVAGTMAHIHQGAPGKNGPVIIPLNKEGDHDWVVPAGSKLDDAQFKAFKAGELYVNVHSAENKGGEIRGQLKP